MWGVYWQQTFTKFVYLKRHKSYHKSQGESLFPTCRFLIHIIQKVTRERLFSLSSDTQILDQARVLNGEKKYFSAQFVVALQ